MKTSFYVAEVAEGDFLGDYQVIRVLGRGPLGTTYHVVNNLLDKEFALKTLVLSDHIPLEWIDRLEAQTALLSKLTSAHIDWVVSSGRHQNLWFCLKDFVHDGEGEACDLRQYVRRYGGQPTPYQTLHIVYQVLEGLQGAFAYEDSHHQGICHGNLKPENVLMAYSAGSSEFLKVSTPFEVRLTDFQPYGLVNEEIVLESFSVWENSLHAVPHTLAERALSTGLTALYRSFDYCAPEKLKGGKPTVASDIYSVGVIAYELLTGQYPEGRFKLPTAVNGQLSPCWDKVISRALAYNPADRYTSYQQFQEDLKEELDETQAPLPQQPLSFQGITPRGENPAEKRSITPPGMVYIPAGKFFIGSAECGEDCLPQHECSTDGFYMDRHPVTVAQFKAFVDDTGYVTEAEKDEKGAPVWVNGEWQLMPGVNWKQPMGGNPTESIEQCPVTQVTHTDASAYAHWLGRRLPTEQEWEYAASGGLSGVRYPWGEGISRANANYNSDAACPVMRYQANGYGLYDMAGNVWEWTSSWYKAYPGNLRENPHFGEHYLVVRGGAWLYDGAHCMVSYRNANDPGHTYPTVGFRTVCDFKSRI